jgi:hypothetical protein
MEARYGSPLNRQTDQWLCTFQALDFAMHGQMPENKAGGSTDLAWKF